ncbi:MAG: DUF4157 domain-containing protein [Gemmatimonadota bacterium]
MAILGRLMSAAAGRPEPRLPVAVPEGVRVVRGRWIPALGGRLSGMGRPAAAVTLGRTIVVHPEARLTARLLRHELAHTRQWDERPFLFPLLYIARHAQYGYARNPYEVAARAAESGDAEGCATGDAETRQSGENHGQS